MTKNVQLKNAIKIGIFCTLTYFMNYYMRNILGVVTPSILEEGVLTKEYIASLSAAYMFAYAAGQLVSGFVGDRLKAKYMVLIGYMFGSIALFVFPATTNHTVHFLVFILMGAGFSMLRGPLVKTISENMLPKYARVACTMFSFTFHFSPMVTGLLALVFEWRTVFIVSGVAAVLTAAAGFCILSLFEKKGIINMQHTGMEKQRGGIFGVFFLDKFVFYMLLGIVFEIAASAITFWIPTYLNEYLYFSSKQSGIIFSIISMAKSVCPFIALFLIKLFKYKDISLMRFMLGLSSLMFALMLFVTNPLINILMFIAALTFTGIASAALWNGYIPSLAKTGKVSSANGVLDCSGYIGAAAASYIFARVIEDLGWHSVILTWACIMLAGVIITFFAARGKYDVQ